MLPRLCPWCCGCAGCSVELLIMPHNQRQSDTLTASVICIMPAPPPAPATSYPCKYCCRSEKIFPPPARGEPAAAAAACPLVRGAGDDWSGAPPQSPATSPAHSAAGKTAKTEFCSINGILLIPFLPSLNMSPCTAAVLGPNTHRPSAHHAAAVI